jgi:hypothetical protein
MVERRPGPHGGKAAVVWEDTGRGTPRAAGGEVHARRARDAESTSGRSSAPQGRTATGTALGLRVRPRPEEGGGLTQESVGARTAGDPLLPWSFEPTRREVTPRAGQGALGPGLLQESPDRVGPEHKGAPWEAHHSETGWM